MIIATRNLFIRCDNGPLPVSVSIHAPENGGDDWACVYEIGWPEGVRRFSGHGSDSIQALYIALQMIGAELYASDYHKRGELFAEDLDGGYGFPIAKNCRDLLVGDDKAMF